MASSFFLVIILAISTFTFLDINQNESFQKTTTAKYLNQIGLLPRWNQFLRSDFYKQYIRPITDAISKTLGPILVNLNRLIKRSLKQIDNYVRPKLNSLLKYCEQQLLPSIEKNWSKLIVWSQKYWDKLYWKTLEFYVWISEWVNKNIITNKLSMF
ncbi:hypothetical protein SSS_10732 [Sarcoptes scabiei]|nr:hypothetical protein SSS_10732 [Sarcoptes scabiei]